MTFWSEVKKTLQLAAPLIMGQISAVAITFVDTVMAGRIDALALAAVAIGGAYWTAGMLFVLGVLMAVPPHVSQLVGARRTGETGAFVRQAFYVAIGLALVYLFSIFNAHYIFDFVGVESEIVPVALGYLDAIAWGVPALCGYFLLRFVSEGLSIMRATMYFGLFGLAINIPANYVLMFGHLGFPAYGAKGAGYASSLTQWCQFAALLIYVYIQPRYQAARLFEHLDLPDWHEIKEILRVGLPIGGAVFIEGSLFVTVALLMGSLGTVVTAAHQAAINFTSLAFMVPLGMSMAVTVRVGNAVGRGSLAQARRAGLVGFAIVLVTQSLSATIMLLFPDWVAVLYTEDPQVHAMILNLLLLAAIFQLPDGFQVLGAGALRGLKDTRVPMVYTVIAYWIIGIPTGYLLGISMGYGAEGMWIGLIGGLSVASILMLRRFLRLSSVTTV
ncbi:MAG: MATE family efflux transporter [Gammaproteobacteria bacterium]|nr:MATE family efflux transporter [Gammaproteobacteria bacterium]